MSKALKTPSYGNADLKEFSAVVNDQIVTVMAYNHAEASAKIQALTQNETAPVAVIKEPEVKEITNK